MTMRLSKAEREKLTKEAELYEHTCYFISSFSSTKVLDKAYQNVHSVLRDLDVILSSSKTTSSPFVYDVSSMIIKSRSKAETALVNICEKSKDIETKQAFQEFIIHFKQGDLTKYRSKIDSSRDALDEFIFKRKGGTKEKAPQLTKQQKDDQDKRCVYLGKLGKESRNLSATLRFMRTFLRTEQVTSKEQHKLLVSAYETIMYLHSDFRRYITSDEVLCDKDLSLLLSGFRSKVVNVLQGICDNVSNLTVQEAYTRYLDDFKAGLKLSPQDHLSHFQNEDGKITSSKPKMSVKENKLLLRGIGGSTSCETPSPKNEYLRVPPCFNHSNCCGFNDMETPDWEDPNIIMAMIKQRPKLEELWFLPSDDDDDDSE